MTEEDIRRIEKIEGEIAAIGMALNLLLKSQPNPSDLLDSILEHAEQLQARLLASHVPDAVREGADGFVYQWLAKRPKV